jgi:hypothetical protein
LTEAAGWFAEQASQLKLKRDDPSGGIGTFEALETLMLGIRESWRFGKCFPSFGKLTQGFQTMISKHSVHAPKNNTDALRHSV